MKFPCRMVDLTFLDSAPVRFVNKVEINASAEQVFEVFEDGESWTKWYKDIVRVEWTSPKPFGAGTTRTVTLKSMTVYEKFILWDHGKRMAFCHTATSLPFVHAFCEDYMLEPLDKEKTRFTYVVAYDPRILTRLIGPIIKWYLGKTFRDCAQSLVNFMQKK